MHADLEAIVAADEESRARVALAEQRRDHDLAASRAGHQSARAALLAAAERALDEEIAVIRREGDARVADERRRSAAVLQLLAEAGERNFDEAVRKYVEIVITP